MTAAIAIDAGAPHDESRPGSPLVRNGRVLLDYEAIVSPEQARLYAAQVLAAADAAEAQP